MATDIFVTTWNRPQFVERVVRAIRANTLSPHRLVAIDNGSDKETVALLHKLYEEGLIHVVNRNPQNMGLEYARQQALEMAETERFVTTDSDCLPHKPWPYAEGTWKEGASDDWLARLNDLMNVNHDYAAIACRTQVMIGSGDIFAENPPPIVDFTCGGSLRLMRKDVINHVGGWEPVEEGRGNEEHKICNRIRDVGFKCGFASYVPCYHLFGSGNWGYDPALAPEKHGHRPISHPALTSGDDPELLREYE